MNLVIVKRLTIRDRTIRIQNDFNTNGQVIEFTRIQTDSAHYIISDNVVPKIEIISRYKVNDKTTHR
jgi:hypothetical protein